MEGAELGSIADPREDLADDSRAWQVLLTRVSADVGPDHELFGALHFVRCMGARLERRDQGWRIAPGEMSAQEYGEIREGVFRKHGAVLAAHLSDSG